MRSVARGAIGIAMLAALVQVGRADPKADKARADKLFDDGRKYLATKEYALACTAFEQSQVADPAIGTLLNIALCYEQWGHVAAAYRWYVDAEQLATTKHDDRAKAAHKKVEELGPAVPRLTLVLPPGADTSAIVLLDDKEVPRDRLAEQMVEVGPHRIEGRVPGRPPRLTTVELTPGQHAQIVIDLPTPDVAVVAPPPVAPPPPPPRARGRLYAGLALTGAGAVALGVSAFVGLAARQDYGNAIAGCPQLQCTTLADYQATSNARSRANAMTVVGGGGLALAAVGVYLIVTSGGKPAAEPRTALTPLVGGGVTGLAIGGPL